MMMVRVGVAGFVSPGSVVICSIQRVVKMEGSAHVGLRMVHLMDDD